ncbi:sigma-70 family RNA polymerase sigma factor [Crateriforma conspicua]|nr:sigma-70 family RNA polymerase sigma factor [Crateriforma conspicua]QDV65993.1 ECF RNA polymerase sigma-E factor [Crateriforma conspicua]
MRCLPSNDAESSARSDAVGQRIAQARQGNIPILGQLLQRYQHFLSVQASAQLHGRLRRRVSDSDLVQETMLAAHRDFHRFRGTTEGELLAWLRQILNHCLNHAVEKNVFAQKRDVRREVSLEALATRSSDSVMRLSHIATDRAASPSEVMQKQELADDLSRQLGKLKDNYRDVIVYRNLQGMSFEEIGQRMNVKSGTARMMWVRAIAKFKEIATPPSLSS